MLLRGDPIERLWKSDRPLIFLDLETDGPGEPDPGTDRIVQIGFLMVEVNGERGSRSRLVHPGPLSMPLKRTEIHGVTDQMLVGAPTFASISKSFREQLQGSDIATFNGANYDVPVLWEEFFRAGIIWDISKHNFIDVSRLWSKMEPRSLSDAFRRFTGKEPPTDMHDAGIDTLCTFETLQGMFAAWSLAPRDVVELAKLTSPTTKIGGKELPRIDLAGAIVRNENGDAVYAHRTNRGILLKNDLGYARWILGKDFPENTKTAIRAELKKLETQQSLPM